MTTKKRKSRNKHILPTRGSQRYAQTQVSTHNCPFQAGKITTSQECMAAGYKAENRCPTLMCSLFCPLAVVIISVTGKYYDDNTDLRTLI